jgi:hypothetical protein
VLVKATVGECDDMVERLARLAPGRAQLDPMAAERAQGGYPGQAGGRNGARSGVEVAKLDPRVEQASLLNQTRGRSGMQTMLVGDLYDRRVRRRPDVGV